MIVGGEDSSNGLFVTEEESPYEEPKVGPTLLDETSPILYVAPATIQDTLMKAQVIASAWELMWWKKGDTGGAEKAAPEIQSIQSQSKESTKRVKLVPASVPQSAKSNALEAVMEGMSSWCPTSEVVVKGSPLDHFAIRLEKDTIAFTEDTRFYVQAKDASDQDIELDAATPLRVSVVENTEYGTFIDKKGDTLKTVPVTLSDIPYGDAKDGLIRIAAVKKNPDSLEVCRLRAELQSDAGKKGEKDVPVLEQTLKIVMTFPYEVQPVIPPATVNHPNTENRKEFAVRLTRGGKPVASHPFHLTTNYVDGSGGHDHIDPRRTEDREHFGHFILVRTQGHVDQPYDGETQADGKDQFDYVASIFGDRMKIRVDSRRNQLLWDTLSVAEKVPGLMPLPTGVNNLVTYTSTERYHSRENSNYARADVVAAVSRAVTSYAEEYGLEDDVFLAAIDMSLPLGGKFEINGDWESGKGPHQYHRVGKSIDFSHTYRDDSGAVITVDIYENGTLQESTTQIDEKMLDAKFDRNGFDRWERSIGKIHYEYR